MRLNVKKYLKEATGPEGFIGFESDIEAMTNATSNPGIANPQNYAGAFGSLYQNQPNYKPVKTLDQEQVDQLQTAVFSYLSGEFIDPRQPLYNVKVKLNHLGLDFDITKNTTLNPGRLAFKLSRFGQKFGTTPTNDLSKGFDKGTDYTDSLLTMDLVQSQAGKYYFRNIKIEQTGNTGMQAENFYSLMAQHDYLAENVFKPIVLNLIEKAERNELTDKIIEQQLGFIIERATKHLNIMINEEDKNNLTKGLYKMIFEEKEEMGEMETIEKLSAKQAKSSGKKSPSEQRRSNRAKRIALMKKQMEEKKNK